MIRAVKILTDDTREIVHIEDDNFLDTAQSIVEGCYDYLDMHRHGWVEWHNDEYLYQCQEQNGYATALRIAEWGEDIIPVFGNVVYTGLPDKEGRTTSLNEAQIRFLLTYPTRAIFKIEERPMTQQEAADRFARAHVETLTHEEWVARHVQAQEQIKADREIFLATLGEGS